ncbi:hypothetical protein FSP39_017112 [Pinctada imbricata]|uniref:Galaxin-like repeats domain-containing protein n=1 Tax=Pinctada imbricata TaxID=66713 RepID=A0AA88XX78_PINIB|nr:hypothetical protein FSP39_017112 [Pinctada imbricata]
MKNDKCCNEKIIPGIAEDDDTYQCCGEKVIKPAENESCCHGEDEYSESAAEEKTICSLESEKGTSNVGCCGNSTFDPGRELCCEGNVETNLGNRECCGASSFDMNNETLMCCSGVLHHMAGKAFNGTTQRCCRSFVVDVDNVNQDCCGGDLHDTTTHGCCSFTSYNKTTHQCCRDTITPLDQECCDSIGYDPSNQICCNYRNEKSMVIRKNSSNDNGCCFVEEDDGTLKPKAHDTKKDLCCGQKILHNASLYGYVCCSKTQKPLVRCSIYDECREYNGSDTCNNYSWSFEDVADPRTYKPTEYNICRLCKGQWSLEDSVDSLRKGHIDTCKKSAIVLSVRKKIKKGRVTLVHFIVESNMFNPKDKSTIKNRLRGFFPCRCNNLRRRDKLILMTNVRIGKVMRLGDSDTVLPFSQTIMYEAIWKKLQCPS